MVFGNRYLSEEHQFSIYKATIDLSTLHNRIHKYQISGTTKKKSVTQSELLCNIFPYTLLFIPIVQALNSKSY